LIICCILVGGAVGIILVDIFIGLFFLGVDAKENMFVFLLFLFIVYILICGITIVYN
tara:strand:- start:80 stop:250 length:171 start_codon:yes stop_codon:yes gene_type:complete